MEELKCRASSDRCMHPWCDCEEEAEQELKNKESKLFKAGDVEDKTNYRSMFAVINHYECRITEDGWTAFIAWGNSEKQCKERAEKLVKLLNNENPSTQG